jgi:hypothetical protein
VLPYVFTSPWADTVIRENDKVYLFGHPTVIRDTLSEFAAGFLTSSKGDLGLRSNIPLSNFSQLRQSMHHGFVGHVASIISEGDEAASVRYTSTIQHYQDGDPRDQEGRNEEGDEEEDEVVRTQESKMEGPRTQVDHIPS